MKFLRMRAALRCGDGMASLKVRLLRWPGARLLAAVLPQLLLVSPALLLELLQLAVLDPLPFVLLPPCFRLKRPSFVSNAAAGVSSLLPCVFSLLNAFIWLMCCCCCLLLYV